MRGRILRQCQIIWCLAQGSVYWPQSFAGISCQMTIRAGVWDIYCLRYGHVFVYSNYNDHCEFTWWSVASKILHSSDEFFQSVSTLRSDSGNTSRDTSIDDHFQKRQTKRDRGFHRVPDQVCSPCSPYPSSSFLLSIWVRFSRVPLTSCPSGSYHICISLAFHTSGQHGFEHWSHRTAPWTCWAGGANMNVGPRCSQNRLLIVTEYPHIHAHLNSFTSSNSCFLLMIWMFGCFYHKKQSSSLLKNSTQKLRKTWNCQHSSLQHALGRHPRRDPANARLGMVLRFVCLLFPWQSERLIQAERQNDE